MLNKCKYDKHGLEVLEDCACGSFLLGGESSRLKNNKIHIWVILHILQCHETIRFFPDATSVLELRGQQFRYFCLINTTNIVNSFVR